MISSFFERALAFAAGRFRIGNDVFIDRDVRIDFASERRRRSSGSLWIGNGSTLCKGVIISMYGGIVNIGSDSYIGPYVVIYGHGGVGIGNNVLIANHTTIVSSAHNYARRSSPICHQGERLSPVTIEDDVWIGSGARIMAGVSVGKGSVIGANSVLTKSTSPYSISYGVPAKAQNYRS